MKIRCRRWLTSGEVRQNFIVDAQNLITAIGYENSSSKMWPIWTSVVALYGATAGQVSLIAKEMCSNQACCGLIPIKRIMSVILIFICQTL